MEFCRIALLMVETYCNDLESVVPNPWLGCASASFIRYFSSQIAGQIAGTQN